MRLAIAASIFLIALSMLSGCDSNQYQILTSSDGALYRFNKKTGELSMVMDNKRQVRFAESGKGTIVKSKDDASLEKPMNWGEFAYPGKNLKTRLETVWRENKLCYKISLYPYKSLEKVFDKKKQDYVYSLMKPGFNIELVDKNGFMVKEIRVVLWNMAKARIDNDKEGLVLNSQVDCTKQSYESIGGYIIKWLLDSDLIEDEEDMFIKSPLIRSEKGTE